MKTKRLVMQAAIMVLLFAGALCAQNTSQTFSIGENGKIDISLLAVNIKILIENRNDVQLQLNSDGKGISDILAMKQSGTTLTVTGPKVLTFGNSSEKLELTITIPAKFNVEAKTTGGNITTKGSLSGTVSLFTSAGNINAEILDGNISLDTEGGNISATTLKKDAVVHTSGGNITINELDAAGKVTTEGGNIKIGKLLKEVTIGTLGGNIELGDALKKIIAKTEGGDIKAGVFSDGGTLETQGGNIYAQGGTGNFSVTTEGGNISIKKITGSLQAITFAGNIDAELIPSGTQPSSLLSEAGNITFAVPPTARVTIEAEVEGSWSVGESKTPKLISIDLGVEPKYTITDSNEKATVQLNGGGPVVKLKAEMGKITVKRL